MGRAAGGKAPKSEIRNPKEGRSPKSEKPAKRLGSGYVLNTISKNQRKNQAMPPTKNPDSGFGFRTSFGFRISRFGFLSGPFSDASSRIDVTHYKRRGTDFSGYGFGLVSLRQVASHRHGPVRFRILPIHGATLDLRRACSKRD